MKSWVPERVRWGAQGLPLAQGVAATTSPGTMSPIHLAPSPEVVSPKPESSISIERAEIMRRVAAFRALQARLGHERAQYYDAMQAKIRTALGH